MQNRLSSAGAGEQKSVEKEVVSKKISLEREIVAD